MKITNNDFKQLSDEFQKFVSSMGEEKFKEVAKNCKKTFTEYPRVKIPFKRFCFDVFYALPRSFRDEWTRKVYAYANDDNIFTALKKLITPYYPS